MKIVLASGSPRRQEILKRNGIDAIVMPTDTDETIPNDAKDAAEVSEILSFRKAEACLHMINFKNALIIAADTIVVSEDCKDINKFGILGKPENKEKARMMIRAIEGKRHEVITGCTLIYYGSDCLKKVSFHERTEVFCNTMSDDEIEAYISTDEPYDKAGGYGIQGLFGRYIDYIKGDYCNVIGLPFTRLNNEMKKIIKA